jgi:hypothetical protein
MLIVVNTGITTSYFTDGEQSTNDTLNIKWSVTTLLSDGFELTPWDQNWDYNFTTDWQTGAGYGGSTYSAEHASGDTSLTSDDLDTSGAGTITVSFWFKIKLLNKGPLYVQIFNGSTYDNWVDLVSYAGGVKNTWIQFSQTITDPPDPQYFISNFSINFDGSALTTDAFIDDVLIQKY